MKSCPAAAQLFGLDAAQKPFMVFLMARVAQPVQLAFGDHRVGFRPDVIDVVLPGDGSVQRVQQAYGNGFRARSRPPKYRASLTSSGAQRVTLLDVLNRLIEPTAPMIE